MPSYVLPGTDAIQMHVHNVCICMYTMTPCATQLRQPVHRRVNKTICPPCVHTYIHTNMSYIHTYIHTCMHTSLQGLQPYNALG